jgi:hypothetical protein
MPGSNAILCASGMNSDAPQPVTVDPVDPVFL